MFGACLFLTDKTWPPNQARRFLFLLSPANCRQAGADVRCPAEHPCVRADRHRTRGHGLPCPYSCALPAGREESDQATQGTAPMTRTTRTSVPDHALDRCGGAGDVEQLLQDGLAQLRPCYDILLSAAKERTSASKVLDTLLPASGWDLARRRREKVQLFVHDSWGKQRLLQTRLTPADGRSPKKRLRDPFAPR
eukprot:g51807.t1